MQFIEGKSPIVFPFLEWELDPPAGISLGALNINLYGMIIAIGLIAAVVYAWNRSREFGFKTDDITDGVLWIVPFAVLCARLYYCIFSWEERGYAENPISILYIWEGGLAIYGGVIGAAIGVSVYCLCKKIKLPALLDLVSLGFLIGQGIGRWGNFFNREAYGAETDFFLGMGLKLTASGHTASDFHYYHPTFLYESVWNFLGFGLLHFLSKKRKYDGQIALGYVAWYGLGRALIEGLRTDSLYWGDFRVSQLLAALTCAGAVIVLMVQAIGYHAPEKLYVNQVATAEEQAENAEAAAEEKAADEDNDEDVEDDEDNDEDEYDEDNDEDEDDEDEE